MQVRAGAVTERPRHRTPGERMSAEPMCVDGVLGRLGTALGLQPIPYACFTLATTREPVAIHVDLIGEVRSLENQPWNFPATQITHKTRPRKTWKVSEPYADVMARVSMAWQAGRARGTCSSQSAQRVVADPK